MILSEATYDYCFQLIEAGIVNGTESFQDFAELSSSLAPRDLSLEEREAAESLAWKALLRGWTRATSGFSEQHEIHAHAQEGGHMSGRFEVRNSSGVKATITIDAPLTEYADGENVLVFDDHQVVVATIEPGEGCEILEVAQ